MTIAQVNNTLTSLPFEVGSPLLGWLVVFALVAIGVFVWAALRRRQAIRSFSANANRFEKTNRFNKTVASAVMLVLTIVFLCVALVDLRWGKSSYEVPQKGMEVVFALDVSRSMLAQDAAPNRLIRAKQQIKDLVSEMAGDRIGLVVFAGEAQQVVPLTRHYDDFEIRLDSVGPHSVPVGGSRLGVAIEAAADSFIGKTDGNRTVVLFTDGEDQESDPIALARQFYADEGIRFFTIGLGDIDQGARIPAQGTSQDSFVKFEGQPVWSKLNGRILKQIASETDAAYIPAGIKRVNMSDVYRRYIDNVSETDFETAKIDAYTPQFQWFAGAALACLLIEVFISTMVSRKQKQTGSDDSAAKISDSSALSKSVDVSNDLSSRVSKVSAASVAFVLMAISSVASAQQLSVEQKINEANELLRNNQPIEAINAFQEIDVSAKSKAIDLRNYNLAIAQYRNADYDAAIGQFRNTASTQDTSIAANSRFNLGNCHYAKAISVMSEQPKQAVVHLQDAIINYRSSLRLDRNNADARTNIELAKKLIKQLDEQREEKQPQQQPDPNSTNEEEQQQEGSQPKQGQEQPEQNESENNESEADQPENAEQQNESSDPNSGSEQPDVESQQTENSDPENSDQSDRQSSTGQPQEPANRSNAESDATESESAKDSDQANAEKPSDESGVDESAELNPNEAEDQKTDGELSLANQNTNEEIDSENSAKLFNNRNAKMTREEALKLLQSVRDRDMLRRFQQQQRQRSRRVRVEKDW